MASITAAKPLKRVLRKDFSARLVLVSHESILAQSKAVTERIVSSLLYQSSTNISIYLSTPTGEIQTDSIIRHAFSANKRIYIPYCPPKEPTVMRMLRLKSLEQFEGLRLNKWRIREFDEEQVREAADVEDEGGLDMILVPGLMFDRTRQRLGHGRGYYDRYIKSTETYSSRFNKPPPQSVAIALREQLLPEGELVPTEEWDEKPVLLVTPDETFFEHNTTST